MSAFSVVVIRSLSTLAGYSPLGELNTHPVGAGLKDNGVLFYGTDSAHNAADGGNDISHLEAGTHFVRFLLPLVFRPDEKMAIMATSITIVARSNVIPSKINL